VVPGAKHKNFVTGMTKPTVGGLASATYEYMPLERWVNEREYKIKSKDPFDYLHNTCAPNYMLSLGIMM
jgi:hypothetical protein